jgi:hypothetical protein
MIKHFVLRFLPLLLLLILLPYSVVAVPTEPAAPEGSPNWSDLAAELTNSTNTPNGATLPFVESAPNGKTIIVAYIKRITSETDSDPFFVRSTNNGQTWSAPAPIHQSAGINAFHAFVEYDANNAAHAVWIENENQLAYKKETAWGSGSFTKISEGLIAVDTPQIFATGNGTLDLIWTQNNGANPNVYHARSNNGNTATPTWPIKGLIQATAGESKNPSLAVDASGNIHVVWEEQDPLAPTTADIYYVRGSVSGSTVTWSSPIQISDKSAPTNAREPDLIVEGNTIHVIYTDRVDENTQFIHHIECDSNCTTLAGWNSDGNVSGQKVGANTSDPFDVISTLTQFGGCTLVYFHGTVSGLPDKNETIWGVNNCEGWTANRDQVTTTDVRSINPNITVQNDWWVYLVYEEVGATHQIRFVRNKPGLYLPVIQKR